MTDDTCAISIDGRSVTARAGTSLAAAMIAAGERVCRDLGAQGSRGVFCGMGVCGDCAVTVDDAPHRRACMTTLHDGAHVTTTPFDAIAAPEPPRPEVTLTPDIVVIGGGPAGLAAASVAAECGSDVVLVDERAKLGGQFYKQPFDGGAPSDAQFAAGQALIARAERAGVKLLRETQLWAAFAPDDLAAVGPETRLTLRPKRLILATGAYERAVPMPGWTLPGFMTTGAAQTLLRAYRTAPGKRVLIAGNGPLNFQVASELLSAGVEVVALAELAPRPGLAQAGALARMLASAPDLVRDGRSYVATLRRRGVAILHRHAVIRAEGGREVERAVVTALDTDGRPLPGSERSFDVDTVCVGYGFLPANEIARALGCRHGYDARRGHLVAERDARCRSSLGQVWIVGDGGGLGGARLAQAQGIVAGLDAAASLGVTIPPPLAEESRRAAGSIPRHERFQEALWSLFRAPYLVDQLAQPDTLICRCENVTLAAVRQAIDGEALGLGAIKRLTRAGMGRCQGRYCASLIAAIAARRAGRAPGELDFFAPRTPFKPMAIAAIAPLESD